ncbi:MAG: BMC domain-containing protein [Deltaproteobacteria bacterium]|jgi:ethanolamine utilization protein EutM|nr:BMC domain-containing protein [Deltaproteobacteria bacterium]
MQSLGFIEVKGLVTAIEAADAALKTANVTLLGGNNPGAGLFAVIFEGEIGAIKTAVDAGAAAAKKVGEVVSVNVIARPDEETYRMAQEPTL